MSIHIDLRDDLSERVPYDYTGYPICIRHSFISAYPNYAASSHWHDDVEFVTVLHGEMAYNVNGEIISMKPGEGMFVNSRQMHFGFSGEHRECEFATVVLHPMLLCLTSDIEQNYVAPVLHNQNIPYIRLTGDAKWHKEIINGIHNIHSVMKASGAVLKMQSIFTWMWALIYENMPRSNSSEPAQNRNLSILKDMIDFIQQHYDEKITLQQIAKSGGIGQSKCCKLFQTFLHQTPNSYFVSYRLSKSTELLCITDMTITEIAYAVGFNGASYYAEMFHKYFGISPSAYRQKAAFNRTSGPDF